MEACDVTAGISAIKPGICSHHRQGLFVQHLAQDIVLEVRVQVTRRQ